MPKAALPLPVLTDVQKADIEAHWQMDIAQLAQKVFDDPTIDLRRIEVKAVRAYLATIGKGPELPKPDPVKQVTFTTSQIEFIRASYEDSTPVELARTIFEDKSLTPGDVKVRAVLNAIRKIDPDYRKDDQLVDELEYTPPKTPMILVGRINRYGVIDRPDGKKLGDGGLNGQEQKQVDALLRYMRLPVFKVEAEKFTRRVDRDVFESVFLGTCWDKPDLSPEHVIQYIHFASLSAQRNMTDRMMRTLDERFMASLEDAGQKLSKSEVDALKEMKDKASEHLKQISALIKTLTGERAKIINEQMAGSASMHPLVAAWKTKEGRERVLEVAEKYRGDLKDEIARLSEMDQLKCEILGLSPSEILK